MHEWTNCGLTICLRRRICCIFGTPDQVDHAKDTTSLQRVGTEAKQPIICHYHQGVVEDTPQTRDLRRQRRREYDRPRWPDGT
jgi:hypothetical protein